MKADDHLPKPPRLDSLKNGLSSDGHPIVERKTSWASMSTSSSTPNPVPITNVHNSLFVQGLPQGLGSADLVTIFSQFGEILSSTRVIHGRGYGFVDFATDKGFETALNSAEKNLLQIDGLSLRIERVKTPGGVRESVNVIPATNKSESTFHPPKTSTRLPLKPVLRGLPHRRSNPQLELQQQRQERSVSFHKISLGNLQRIPSTVREERKHRSLVNRNRHKTHPAKMMPLNHNRIVIQQIPEDTTIEDLKKVFAAYGSVRRIYFRKKALSSDNEDGSDDDFNEDYDEEIASEVIAKAKTMHFLNIRYSDGTKMAELIETIEKEGLTVKQTDTTAIRVGPYDVRPNLMEGIEFLDPFGDLLGVEIQTIFFEAVVVYEYEASVEKVMKAPVFCRGAELTLEVKAQ